MKNLIFIIIALIPVITVAGEYPATVKTIKNGDTIVVTTRENRDITIQLYGIDAPEGKQPGGKNATEALSAMLADGMEIHVSPIERDRYKRTVAIVYAGDEPVNARMVEAGWARVSTRFCKLPICGEWSRLEQEARVRRRGMWRDGEPIPPRKKGRARRKQEDAFSATVVRVTDVEAIGNDAGRLDIYSDAGYSRDRSYKIMTTNVKQYEFRTPSGKLLRASRQAATANVERLAAEADTWYERNKRHLQGYSVEQFLEEKRLDVEKGLL